MFNLIGHILQPGDTVLGYDVAHSVMTAEGEQTVNNLPFDLPDVILVRKSYPENVKTRKRKNNKPNWMRSGPTAANPTVAPNTADISDNALDFEVENTTMTVSPTNNSRKGKKVSMNNNSVVDLGLTDVDDADKRAIIEQMEDEWEMEQEEQLYLQAVKASSKDNKNSKSDHLSLSEWEHLEASLVPPNLSGEMYDDIEVIDEGIHNQGDESDPDEEVESNGSNEGYATDDSNDETNNEEEIDADSSN